ncbi:MAG: hypothetical protein ABSE07_07705 [Methanoregula sp.]
MNDPRRKIAPVFKVVFTLSFAIILAFICYFLFTTFLLNPWLETNQRELCVLNFYAHKNISTVPEIFFIGTSQVKEGLDCYIIENDFKKSNISFNCYNLAVNADSPLRRLIELDSIIKSKPQAVVIGTGYSDIYQGEKIDDSRLMLVSNKIVSNKIVSNKIILDNTSLKLFDNKQLELLNLNPIERDISSRIYIISYLNYWTVNKLSPNSDADYAYRNNFKDPHTTFNDPAIENLTIKEKIALINKYSLTNDTVFAENYGDTANKLALKHIIQELNKNNITVILVAMPLDPLGAQTISDTTQNNYFSFLNSTGAPSYNFQNRYPSNYFHDLDHMNVEGRTSFSHDIAEIIIKEVEQ